MQAQLDRRGNIQKWINVAVCALMIFFCLGFCSSNKSLYLSAITEAQGFKRSAYAMATSCRFITTAVVNMFFGYMMRRFGTKKLMLAGVICLMISMYINSVATNIYMFCISEAIAGIGFSWSGTAMVGSVIYRWCKENTGTITGAALAANGIGGALAAQIVTPIIYQPDNLFGYQDAYRLVMVFLVVVFIIISVLFRENPPEGMGCETVTVKRKKRGAQWVGISYDEVKKKRFYYGALICIFLTGMCLQGVGGIASAHFRDVGFNTAIIASVASVSSLALTGSKLLSGFMYDKLGLRRTISICCMCAVIDMFILATVSSNTIGTVLIFVYSVLSAIALPLETVMLPLYANDLFGEKSYNKVMGLVISANTLGYAVGTPLTNACYDIYGTYRPILFLMGIIMLSVLIMLWFVIQSAHRTRDEIVKENSI